MNPASLVTRPTERDAVVNVEPLGWELRVRPDVVRLHSALRVQTAHLAGVVVAALDGVRPHARVAFAVLAAAAFPVVMIRSAQAVLRLAALSLGNLVCPRLCRPAFADGRQQCARGLGRLAPLSLRSPNRPRAFWDLFADLRLRNLALALFGHRPVFVSTLLLGDTGNGFRRVSEADSGGGHLRERLWRVRLANSLMTVDVWLRLAFDVTEMWAGAPVERCLFSAAALTKHTQFYHWRAA